MKTMNHKINILIFILFLFGMSIGSIVAKDSSFSELENRVLASAPSLSISSLLDGSFGDDVETYTSDQLLMKSFFIQTKNSIDRSLGKETINNVYYTKNKRYIQQYTMNEAQLETNVTSILDWCKTNGFHKNKATFLLAPNASTIYSDELPALNNNETQSDSYRLINSLAIDQLSLVNPARTLYSHHTEDIYYKTDHHWTMLGAYYAYEDLARIMNINHKTKLSDMKEINADDPFYGSLYSQAPIWGSSSDNMTLYDYKDLSYQLTYTKEDMTTKSFLVTKGLNKKDKYTTLFGGNYAEIKIHNRDNKKGKKLLIFKDSYANSLIPYLIKNYTDITMIDMRYNDEDVTKLGKKGHYDHVLFLYNMDFLNSDDNFKWLSEN